MREWFLKHAASNVRVGASYGSKYLTVGSYLEAMDRLIYYLACVEKSFSVGVGKQ